MRESSLHRNRSVGEFYYRYILGIRPLEPGYAKIGLRPFIDRRLGRVEGCYHSRRGEIKVAWQVEEDKVKIQIVTPGETRLTLPDGTVHMLEAGNHEYCQDYSY